MTFPAKQYYLAYKTPKL